MNCAWDTLSAILPQWMRKELTAADKNQLLEIRLRLDKPPELNLLSGSRLLQHTVTSDDLNFCINTASRYSPWAAASVCHGYITAPGGHRIGLCGEAVIRNGSFDGIRKCHSLCIRIARDFTGLSSPVKSLNGCILILGAPGWGKTTLLRDVLRKLAETETVCVIDEREELFPESFTRGKRMDVLFGCPKPQGIDILLRTMGPDCIGIDEITAPSDCEALIHAAGCGVRLVATAHASSLEDFLRRTIYHPLVEQKIFGTYLILRKDKTFYEEHAA